MPDSYVGGGAFAPAGGAAPTGSPVAAIPDGDGRYVRFLCGAGLQGAARLGRGFRGGAGRLVRCWNANDVPGGTL